MLTMQETDISIIGRKVFFLYPHSIIQTEALDHLSNLEYEVFAINDAEKMLSILQQCHDSILFINIDSFMSTVEWLNYVTKIRLNEETKSTMIGILTNSGTDNQLQLIKTQFKPQAGLISIRSELKATMDAIVATLEQFNCHGRRKYVRTYCKNDATARVNFPWHEYNINLQINDISSVGMCCFDSNKNSYPIPTNTKLTNVLLTLRGIKVICDLILYATKVEEGITYYVFLFPPTLENLSRDKIRKYIRINLLSQIESLV